RTLSPQQQKGTSKLLHCIKCLDHGCDISDRKLPILRKSAKMRRKLTSDNQETTAPTKPQPPTKETRNSTQNGKRAKSWKKRPTGKFPLTNASNQNVTDNLKNSRPNVKNSR
ncbi:13387_t:CDS:1, partial [Ambispora gerdemannii]